MGALIVREGGRTGTLHYSSRRLFKNLTSELNSHLAVHEDQVRERGVQFLSVVHAQPVHLTYLSHIATYRATDIMNARLIRWEPETIVALPEGIKVLEFMIPGSEELQIHNVAGLRGHRIVLWSKHGVMARSDVSPTGAVDKIEYAGDCGPLRGHGPATGAEGRGPVHQGPRAGGRCIRRPHDARLSDPGSIPLVLACSAGRPGSTRVSFRSGLHRCLKSCAQRPRRPPHMGIGHRHTLGPDGPDAVRPFAWRLLGSGCLLVGSGVARCPSRLRPRLAGPIFGGAS